MSTAGPAAGPVAARRPRLWLVVLLVLAALVGVLLMPLGAVVAPLVALVVGVLAARRRGQRLLAGGLGLLAGGPAGALAFVALQIASLGTGPVALLHGLAVTGWVAGTACLVAGIVVLAVVWARTCGQRTGPAVTAAAAVVAVVAGCVLAWAWGRAFDIADAGGSTTAYDPVLKASVLAVLACAAVGVAAAGVTLARSRR